MSGGQQEPVSEEPWLKRGYETWREGQRSRLPNEPGPIGSLDPLGPPLKEGGKNDTLNFNKLVQVGKEEGPIVQVSWAHILSGV